MIKKQILLSLVVASALFVGCGDKATETTNTKEVKVEPKQEVVETKVVEVVPKAKAKVKTIVKKSADTGASLFKKCQSCHGAKAEKVALGKSKIIKGWEASKIASALNGYKDGSYGGVMKGVMLGQVKDMSAEQIKLLSKHIASF
jgi:cytochrome c553